MKNEGKTIVTLNTHRYEYISEIRNLITGKTAVLCKDENGESFFCSKAKWDELLKKQAKAQKKAEQAPPQAILVHSSALLEQWEKSLSEFLIFEEKPEEQPKKRGRRKKLSNIGKLGAGKNTLNGRIDIAIMQSVVKGDEVKPFVKDYGMVIVDECHHVSAFSFEKVLKTVSAKYVYGLTATAIRQDGHQPIIFMQCGSIRYKADASVLRLVNSSLAGRLTEIRL